MPFIHEKYMQQAINIGWQGVGNMFPARPSVGAVIVNNGNVISVAHTGFGGNPHAEPQAIKIAEENLGKGNLGNSVLYVTLEPCSHTGRTQPCAEAVIKSGIKHVVIANQDPNPQVAGAGIKMLEEAGIKTEVGILKEKSALLHAGFFMCQNKKRPYITLKLAFTNDGKLIPESIDGRFTSDIALQHSHALRYKNEGILVGINTAVADNPSLNCRLNGLEESSPIPIILGYKDELLQCSNLIARAQKSKVICISNNKNNQHSPFENIYINPHNLHEVTRYLCDYGITRLLIEGGGEIAKSFLDTELVDELHIIDAPEINGKKGACDIKTHIMQNANRYQIIESRSLGDNVLNIYLTNK